MTNGMKCCEAINSLHYFSHLSPVDACRSQSTLIPRVGRTSPLCKRDMTRVFVSGRSRACVRSQTLSDTSPHGPHCQVVTRKDTNGPLSCPWKPPLPKTQSDWWLGGPENLVEAESEDAVFQMLASAANWGPENERRLVVFEFYAPWCHGCKAQFPKLKQIAGQNPNVLFVKINFDKHHGFCKRLGVSGLPMVMFFSGAAGKVEAFNCNISKISLLREKLKKHSAPQCSLGPATLLLAPESVLEARPALAEHTKEQLVLVTPKTAHVSLPILDVSKRRIKIINLT